MHARKTSKPFKAFSQLPSARSNMLSYNHAQRAVAGGKQACRKAALFPSKTALINKDIVFKARKALALPSVPILALGNFRIKTCEDLFTVLCAVLVAWLLQQGIEASDRTLALKVRLTALYQGSAFTTYTAENTCMLI
jgi:hypothetical protein